MKFEEKATKEQVTQNFEAKWKTAMNILRTKTPNVADWIQSFRLTIVQTLILMTCLVGCSTEPARPMYKIQVGWTKDRVMQDSKYRDSQKTVATTSTANGTVEMWSFGSYGEVPFARVYFNSQGNVIMFNCLRYCN